MLHVRCYNGLLTKNPNQIYLSHFCNSITVSTWLDCSRLMSNFCSRSREFIKTCFCHKTHLFLPLCVLGNRSKTLLLPIICKRTDLTIASRLHYERISPKSIVSTLLISLAKSMSLIFLYALLLFQFKLLLLFGIPLFFAVLSALGL